MASPDFQIEVKAERLLIRLEEAPDGLIKALLGETKSLVDELRSRAVSLASGDVVRTISGRYVRSIKKLVRVNRRGVTGGVHSRDPRAGIFEWGGTTSAHQIVAKNAKALAFLRGGQQVFAAAVNHPGSKIPKFGVLHKALDESRDEIRTGLINVVRDEMNKQ